MSRGKRRWRDRIGRRGAWVLGLVVVAPLVAVDPAVVVLLFDVELLVLLGSLGLRMTRDDLAVLWHRVLASQVVIDTRAGWRLSWQEPRTLLHG